MWSTFEEKQTQVRPFRDKRTRARRANFGANSLRRASQKVENMLIVLFLPPYNRSKELPLVHHASFCREGSRAHGGVNLSCKET